MTLETSFFETRLATDETDLLAAQRLRYRVFVEELGGDGPLVDHVHRLERDEFDAVVDKDKMIDDGVELVALQPADVIDQGAIAAQFLDKDAIPQTLCRQQIGLVSGQPGFEKGSLERHLPA